MNTPSPEDFRPAVETVEIDGKKHFILNPPRMMPLYSADQPTGYYDENGELMVYSPKDPEQ